MVLPLKRRVSGLFLWSRCVSLLWSSVLAKCCLVPTCPPRGPCMRCCMLSPLFILSPPGFCPPSSWALCLRSHSVFVLVDSGAELCCLWFQCWVHTPGRSTDATLCAPVLVGCLSRVLLPPMYHLSFFSFSCLLCFCGPLRICLSCFENKFPCQLFRLKASKSFSPGSIYKF